jgi:hypothetical protein
MQTACLAQDAGEAAANEPQQAVEQEAAVQQPAADPTATDQQPADPPANDGAQTAASPTAAPEAVAANDAFEKLVEQWNTAIADAMPPKGKLAPTWNPRWPRCGRRRMTSSTNSPTPA